MRNQKVHRIFSWLWDGLAWIAGTWLALVAIGTYDPRRDGWANLVFFLLTALALLYGYGAVGKIYRGRFKPGSFEEVRGLAGLGLAAAIGTVAVSLLKFGDTHLPIALYWLAPSLALLLMLFGRMLWRANQLRVGKAHHREQRVLVYGAGEAASQVLRLIQIDGNSPYQVVGLIDDDPAKQHLKILGVPVLGGRSKLLELAAKLQVDTVILAITTADGAFVGQLQEDVNGAGLKFLTLPPLSEIIDGRIQVEDIRQVEISDILGRHQVHTNVSEIADYVTGKRVLITGAGGSIGSELARQVRSFNPAELVMLDRDESALHEAQLKIYGRGLLDTPDVVLCDIRDRAALAQVFASHKPQVVFHAAALKHLPMLEQYPSEGWKTNVKGTLHVLELAVAHEVDVLVNISTDKAADPTSVLGATKRIAEQLTAYYAQAAPSPTEAANTSATARQFISVRFGNVLGSRGSVLHAFRAQIEAGGPVTVTHPDITRYFMTIAEACELVIQSGAIGGPGEVLVLDMGEPIKILDVAQRMIQLSGKSIAIDFTGLREGEKLHEDLFSVDERGEVRGHELISHVSVPPLDPTELTALSARFLGSDSR